MYLIMHAHKACVPLYIFDFSIGISNVEIIKLILAGVTQENREQASWAFMASGLLEIIKSAFEHDKINTVKFS